MAILQYSVSSDFQVEIRKPNPNLVRRFLIGTSDYSDYVTKWPSFSQAINDLRVKNLTINLANEDGTFNFFESDKTKLRETVAVRFGVNFGAVGSEELITMFQGKGERVRFRRGAIDYTIVDKWSQLSERVVGSSTDPYSRDQNPAWIGWWLVVSFGGYAPNANTNNPDIDYTAWLDWAGVFSDDSLTLRCNFDGMKITEALRKVAKMTDSDIFITYTNSETKISFNRYTASSSSVTTLTPSESIVDVQLEIDDRKMINRQIVNADYNQTTDVYDIIVEDEATASINSFDEREDIIKDEHVWYTSSATAINLAQRQTSVRGTPYNEVRVRSTLVPINVQAGDGVEIDDSLIGFGQSFRVKERIFNMDDGRLEFKGDASAFFDGFTLDIDSLDSPDKLLL